MSVGVEPGGTKVVEFTLDAVPRAIIEAQISAAVLKAVAAEREACAKIALEHGTSNGENCWNHENIMNGRSRCWIEIAEAIRARAS